MPTPNQIEKQINELIKYLVETSFVDDQQFAFQRSGKNDLVLVTFDKAEHVSVSLKDRAYNEIYQDLAQERAYNAKMLDGALIIRLLTERFNATGLRSSLRPTLKNFRTTPMSTKMTKFMLT